MRRPALLLPAAVAAALLLALPARADRLGRGWEAPIEEGIQKQEQERKDRRPESILRQAELLAARRSSGDVRIARVYLLARAYGINGDARSAEGAYKEVLRLARDCYFAYHDLAMLALARKPPDTRQAERYLRQAVQAHPRYTTGYRKLARLLLKEGEARTDEAILLLQRVIDLEPGDLEARHLRARALLAKNRFPEAEKEIVALLRKEPRNPLYRDLKASYYLQTGKIDRAMRTYRDLAEELPAIPTPVQGYMACLQKRKEQGEVDPEAWLWCLERLYRLIRDPEEKKRLKDAIEEFRRLQNAPPETPDQPGGPPTDAQLARLLGVIENAEKRAGLLGYVYSRDAAPEKVLFDAVVRRLGARAEPSPKVRQWALRVLGRFGGLGMVPLVRLALGDTDRVVRTAAIDTLVDLSVTDDAAVGAAILVLGLYAEDADRQVAVAARNAVRDLAKAELPDPAAGTEAAHREAFLAWWRGPAATNAKIRALSTFAHVRDLYPEDVLVPYMQDADPFVADAAWRAMAGIAKTLLERDTQERAAALRENRRPVGLLPAARRGWLGRMPPYREGALRGDAADATRATIGRWATAKP